MGAPRSSIHLLVPISNAQILASSPPRYILRKKEIRCEPTLEQPGAMQTFNYIEENLCGLLLIRTYVCWRGRKCCYKIKSKRRDSDGRECVSSDDADSFRKTSLAEICSTFVALLKWQSEWIPFSHALFTLLSVEMLRKHE